VVLVEPDGTVAGGKVEDLHGIPIEAMRARTRSVAATKIAA
jgi:hypothetical protein